MDHIEHIAESRARIGVAFLYAAAIVWMAACIWIGLARTEAVLALAAV